MKKIVEAKNVRTNIIKNALSTMIKHISVIAIFIAIAVVSLIYLGPEINFNLGFVPKLAVASVVLALSVAMLYELWLKKGRIEASEEEIYKERLTIYSRKSDGLFYPTLQEFLDYERQRRYDVEKDRLIRILEREKSILHKLETEEKKRRLKIYWSKKRINYIMKAINTVKITIPYEKSEEFDYLRYSIQNVINKEYSPKDTSRHLVKKRARKYTNTFTFAIVGFNILSITSTLNENIWQAVIMITLAILTLLYAVIGGYTTGYTNISVINLGVYNTAISFLDQAVAYCQRNNKDLYYRGTTEFRDKLPEEILPEPVKETEDFFTKATISVTGTD